MKNFEMKHTNITPTTQPGLLRGAIKRGAALAHRKRRIFWLNRGGENLFLLRKTRRKAMTHLMQWQAMLQQPGAVRRGVAVLLRGLSRALDGVAVKLEYTRKTSARAVVEFEALELDGRWVGAYYVDGELVSVVPDVTRLWWKAMFDLNDEAARHLTRACGSFTL
jgi:hypothetical protein